MTDLCLVHQYTDDKNRPVYQRYTQEDHKKRQDPHGLVRLEPVYDDEVIPGTIRESLITGRVNLANMQQRMAKNTVKVPMETLPRTVKANLIADYRPDVCWRNHSNIVCKCPRCKKLDTGIRIHE